MDDRNEEAIKIIDNKEKAEIDIDEPSKQKEPNVFKEILNYIVLIAIAFIMAQVIHRYVFTPVTVDGDSMLATLHDDDYLLLWRLGKIDRFDVVVFDVTMDDDPYIKRVIGLPGDYVRYEDDQLYISNETYNNKSFDEPYLDKRKSQVSYSGNFTKDFNLENICGKSSVSCDHNGEIRIPEGYYLVLGDNRLNSTDSRVIGLVNEDQILGKANYILFPLNRFGKIMK